MSLIITRKNTLKNTAVIMIKAAQGDKEIESKGDLSLIKINGEVVSINVFNFNKYFEAKEGVATVNADQIAAIKELGYDLGEVRSYFSVGEITKREVHPKSDRLFVLKVQTEKELNIVTNSTNSLEGTKVVVARLGAVLPSGLEIVKSKVMGVVSEGMLCGGETLGKEKTEGVLLVDGNAGDDYIL